jgi:tetratricopeptide (TPR) repeat protein
MSSRPRFRVLALSLSLVPGWGHIYWGRERLGLAIFTVFAICGFALLNGLWVSMAQETARATLVAVSASLCVLLFLAAWGDLWRRTRPGTVKREAELREGFLRQGTIAYLRGDLKEAAASFREAVRVNPTDVEALFRLGVVHSREGDARQARVWLRKARRHDVDGKWRWEVNREEERLAEVRAAKGLAAPAPVRESRGERMPA